ncbi:hypothetical protein NL676_023701 [Syzygium grande]|nr:hypothetical protein NL676_023701 [Syzygium grande]
MMASLLLAYLLPILTLKRIARDCSHFQWLRSYKFGLDGEVSGAIWPRPPSPLSLPLTRPHLYLLTCPALSSCARGNHGHGQSSFVLVATGSLSGRGHEEL